VIRRLIFFLVPISPPPPLIHLLSRTPKVLALLLRGCDSEAKDEYGATPLHTCLSQASRHISAIGSASMAGNALIPTNTSLKFQPKPKPQPLARKEVARLLFCAVLLLRFGADANAVDTSGVRPGQLLRRVQVQIEGGGSVDAGDDGDKLTQLFRTIASFCEVANEPDAPSAISMFDFQPGSQPVPICARVRSRGIRVATEADKTLRWATSKELAELAKRPADTMMTVPTLTTLLQCSCGNMQRCDANAEASISQELPCSLAQHLGKNRSFVLDGCFSEEWLEGLVAMQERLPLAVQKVVSGT
jgi:hypothetical protein